MIIKMNQVLKRQQKLSKWIRIATILIISLTIFLFLYTVFIQPPIKYKVGQEALNLGNYNEATISFMKSYGYKDSMANLQNINRSLQVISTTNQVALAIRSDSTVVVTGNSSKVLYNVSDWKDIIVVCAGEGFILGVKKDGTVVAAECMNSDTFIDFGQLNVKNWKNIVQISASSEHTIGLKSDGTIMAVGNNEFGQCNTAEWSNIVSVSAGLYCTVGLKNDGTVLVAGDVTPENLRKVRKWKSIVQISANSEQIVGLKANGRVVTTGDNLFNQCRVWIWKDIVSIEAGSAQIIALKADGTIAYCDRHQTYRDPAIRGKDMYDKSTWKDIIAISSKVVFAVGLKSDGTVVAEWGISNATEIDSWDSIFPNKNPPLPVLG